MACPNEQHGLSAHVCQQRQSVLPLLGCRLLEIVNQSDELPVQPFVSHLQAVCLLFHLLTQGIVALPDVTLQVLQPFEDIVGCRNLLVLLYHILLLILLSELLLSGKTPKSIKSLPEVL